jgi:hypothetical protein
LRCERFTHKEVQALHEQSLLAGPQQVAWIFVFDRLEGQVLCPNEVSDQIRQLFFIYVTNVAILRNLTWNLPAILTAAKVSFVENHSALRGGLFLRWQSYGRLVRLIFL